MKRDKTLIVDPGRLSREGLSLIMRERSGMSESAATAREYLDVDQASCPDLVIWGPGVPIAGLGSEMAALRAAFANEGGTFRNVVLANAATTKLVRRLAALDVDALLLADISSEVLQRSIDLVMLGQTLFPLACRRPAKSSVLPFPADLRPVQARVSSPEEREVALSAREEQTLVQLAGGASNKTIAHKLEITESTVKVHVKALLRKIGVTNRTQAAIWAMRNRPAHHPPAKAAGGPGAA